MFFSSLVFDLVWPSLKALSPMNFSGESASIIKHDLAKDLSQASAFGNLIHFLKKFT